MSEFVGDAGGERGTHQSRSPREAFGALAALAPGVSGHERRAPHPPDAVAGSGPAVTFTRSDLTVRWDPSFRSLLELAEACDVPVNFGCRIGVCHYCESGLLTGEVSYTAEPLEAPDLGRILVCCCAPAGDVDLEL